MSARRARRARPRRREAPRGADDKVVTNAGFILIAGFPLLIAVLSLLYHVTEKRRQGRLAAAKARAARARPTRRLVIHYERRGPAALVTIDRPERHNAVDGDTAAALLRRPSSASAAKTTPTCWC